MPLLTESEKLRIKGRLLSVIEKWVIKETEIDNNIGYLPEKIDVLITNAAFMVIESVNATNDYFETQVIAQ